MIWNIVFPESKKNLTEIVLPYLDVYSFNAMIGVYVTNGIITIITFNILFFILYRHIIW